MSLCVWQCPPPPKHMIHSLVVSCCDIHGYMIHSIAQYFIAIMKSFFIKWTMIYILYLLIYLIKLWLCPFDLGYRGCFQESVSHQDHFVWGWWPGTTIWTCSSALPGNIQHPHIADPCTTTPAYRFWGILKILNEWISLVDISYKDFWFKLFN